MLTRRQALLPITLICLYPWFSTFAMTMIWQFTQTYCRTFMGCYFHKWVFLYTVDNSDWLGSALLTRSQIYYSIYLATYVLLVLLTFFVIVSRRRKEVCAWGICGLWVLDSGWIVWDMIVDEITWQGIVNLAEHLIFLLWAMVFSLMYLRYKKENPEQFRRRRRRKTVDYRPRFR